MHSPNVWWRLGSRYRCGGKYACCRRRRSAAPPGAITRPVSRSARASTTSVPVNNPACGSAADSPSSASSRASEVSEQQLEAVFARGLHPVTGEALGRAWRADAVTGFDLTFSAPRASACCGHWVVRPRKPRSRKRTAPQSSPPSPTWTAHAALSRRGTDGVEQIRTGGFAAALFDHRTSRAGDPQLHTHALVPNKLLCADGVWRTVDGHELFHHKKAAGVLYQAALRAELHTSARRRVRTTVCARAGGDPRRPPRSHDRVEQKNSTNRRRSSTSHRRLRSDPRALADPQRAGRRHQNRGAQDSARQRTRRQCVGAARPMADGGRRTRVGCGKPAHCGHRRDKNLRSRCHPRRHNPSQSTAPP